MTATAQPPPPTAIQHRNRLALTTEWMTPSVVRISASGDVDASNVDRLADYVFQRSANCLRLILDLNDVTFFSTAGLTTLLTIDERCTRANVKWMVVPSSPVSRVLDLCGAELNLPVAVS
jgi:anti-anti-sigma factor